jgi:hypothetical protein
MIQVFWNVTLRRWVMCPDVSKGRISFPLKGSGIPELFYLQNVRKALKSATQRRNAEDLAPQFRVNWKKDKSGILVVCSLHVPRDDVK